MSRIATITLTALLGFASSSMLAPAFAAPVTILDMFNGLHAYKGVNPVGSGGDSNDTIGEYKRFDIDKIVFTTLTSSKIQGSIYVNYNNGATSLNAFSVGSIKLGIGDLLFNVNGVTKYGLVLRDHTGAGNAKLDDGLLKGFYTVSGGVTHDSTYFLAPLSFNNYRELTPVRLDKDHASTVANSHVLITTAPVQSQVQIGFEFSPSASFYHDLVTTGLNVHFAAATCANDVIDGHIQATVPEPSTILLLTSGLMGLGLTRLRKKAI